MRGALHLLHPRTHQTIQLWCPVPRTFWPSSKEFGIGDGYGMLEINREILSKDFVLDVRRPGNWQKWSYHCCAGHFI